MHPGLKGGDFFTNPFASSAGKKVFSVMAGNSQQETTSNINYKCFIAIRKLGYVLRYYTVQTTKITNLKRLNRDLH